MSVQPTPDTTGTAPPEKLLQGTPQENLSDPIVTNFLAAADKSVYVVVTNADGSIHEIVPAKWETQSQ